MVLASIASVRRCACPSLLCGMVFLSSALSGHAQAGPAWEVTWYLTKEFGSGHGGHTTFIVPDGAGGVWTNAANAFTSQLWHISEGEQVAPFTVACSTVGRGTEDARGPVGTRGHMVRGLLGAARMPGGRLWLASAEGLVEIEDEATTLHALLNCIAGFGPSSFHFTDSVPPVSTRPTTVVAVDGFGELWAYGPTMGLVRRTRSGRDPRYGVWTTHTRYFPHETGDAEFEDILQGEVVTSMAAPAEGEVVIGTASGDLLFFEQTADRQGTSVKLLERVSAVVIGCAGPVNDIVSDSEGRLWCAYRGTNEDEAGTFGGSVAMLEEGEWKVWNSRNGQLPPRPVMTVCEVRPGEIWAGIDWHDPYVGGSPPLDTGLLRLVDGEWEYVNPPSFWVEPQKVVGVEPKLWRQTICNECTRRISLIRVDDAGRVWVGSHGGLACFEPAARD